MSTPYTVDVVAETITLSASFQKKISKNEPEAYNTYADLKAKYPDFTFVRAEKNKRAGAYDHTTMKDIEEYLKSHSEWKKEFDELFGESIPSKTNACKTVRKAKFVTIRAWFVKKRTEEEANNSLKNAKKATRSGKRKDITEDLELVKIQNDQSLPDAS